MKNVPDDWDSYYFICPYCKKRYHLSSDTLCGCADPEEEEEIED